MRLDERLDEKNPGSMFLGDFFKEKLRIVLNETQTCLIEMEKESDLDKENQELLLQIDQCNQINWNFINKMNSNY